LQNELLHEISRATARLIADYCLSAREIKKIIKSEQKGLQN